MARLIDANAFLESVEGTDWYTIRVDGSATQGAPSEEVAWYKATDIYAAVENAPTVDAVEVVRCKDCKHCMLDLSGRENHLCMRKEVGFVVRRNADDFCSYGERWTDNGKT